MNFIKLARLCLFCLLTSCSQYEPEPFVIERQDICNYFYLQTDTATIDGKKRALLSTEINMKIKDAAGIFFKNFARRFNYLLVKEMNALAEDSVGKNDIASIFCNRLQLNEFYDNILLLTPADSVVTYFTKDEMMRVAARFFYCDTVIKKDGKIGIGSHVCVGINGLSELKNKGKLIALEAFVFEAINIALSKKKNTLIKNFYQYVNEVNKKEKPSYTDDKTYLEKIRKQCYKLMEQDKVLRETLLSYYENKKESIGFGLK